MALVSMPVSTAVSMESAFLAQGKHETPQLPMRCNSRCNSKTAGLQGWGFQKCFQGNEVWRSGWRGYQGKRLPAWLPSKPAAVALVRMSRYASWYAQKAMAQAMQVQVQVVNHNNA